MIVLQLNKIRKGHRASPLKAFWCSDNFNHYRPVRRTREIISEDGTLKKKKKHENNNFWNLYILFLGKPGITSAVLESPHKPLKVASKWARAARVHPDSCLNPPARQSPVSLPRPRTLTKVDRAEQSFLSISDNDKTSDINPPLTLSLPYLARQLSINTLALLWRVGESERREGERKREKARR